MREIKFRVWYPIEWDEIGDKPIKFNMSYDWAFEEWSPINDLFNNSMPDGSILMQFTGLKDKNGKEIYESDILKYSEGSELSHHKIFWDERTASFWDLRIEDGDSNSGYYGFDFVTDCIVIGNIYQNPELCPTIN